MTKSRVYQNKTEEICFDLGDGGPWCRAYVQGDGVLVDASCEPILSVDHAELFGLKLIQFAQSVREKNKPKPKRKPKKKAVRK